MFDQMRKEVFAALDGISWGDDRDIAPDYGQPKEEGLPKLVYRLTTPDIEVAITGSNIRPRLEIEYSSKDEANWFKDQDRLLIALRPFPIDSWTETSVREESETVYTVVIVLGAWEPQVTGG